jgi:O-antigen ligase
LLWVYALRILKDNWLLGVGMENFRIVKHTYGYPLPLSVGRVYNTHNLFLEFFVDLGVTGLLSLLYLLGRAFSQLDRRVRRTDVEGRVLAVGLNAGLLAFAVGGLLDCVTWQHGAFMLLGLLVGMLLSVERLLGSADRTRVPGFGTS